MASAFGRKAPGLIEVLQAKPSRFEFFQAVEVLTAHIREAGLATGARRKQSGEDWDAALGQIRFRATPSLSTSAGHVNTIRIDKRTNRFDLSVSFMGAIGASGVLPMHYTELVIKRLSLRDESLRDFLDIFHHRAISLFYRAWAKYRLESNFARALRVGEEDRVTRTVFSLVGLGTKHLRRRSTFRDEVWAYYAGHFSARTRSATALESLVSDYLGQDVRVEQAVGRWLELDADSQSRLSARGRVNNRLGVDVSLGSRVWDVQSKVRLHVGPLRYADYLTVRKGTRGYRALCDLVHAYLGVETEFDLRMSVREEEAPRLQLTREDRVDAQLGSTSWLRSALEQPLHSTGSILLQGV